MKNIMLCLSIFLGACTPHSFLPFEHTNTGVHTDPDPLCHISYSEDTSALLERLLSADPFDLYEDEYEVLVPYLLPEEVQQRQLPRESYTGACPRL